MHLEAWISIISLHAGHIFVLPGFGIFLRKSKIRISIGIKKLNNPQSPQFLPFELAIMPATIAETKPKTERKIQLKNIKGANIKRRIS